MSIADLFGSVAPQYTMYEADKDQSADYESQIKAYDDAFNQYTQDYDTYKTGAESYNDLVKNYNDKLAAYQTDANAYNTALDIYKKEAQTYNDSLAAYKKQFDDYNAAVNKFNEGDRLTEFIDTDYYVAAPGEFTAKRPDDFTMVRPGEFEVTKPEFTLTEPTAPSDPGFDQAEIDSFIKASQGRARRRGAANAAALNVLGQGGNFSAGAGVQGGAGVSTTPEFSFSATGFEDGGGVGEFFQRFNPLTGSYRKETPLSVKAMEQAQDFTPIGTAETVREIYKESQEEDPNKAKMGIMALAELAGYAPAVGPSAKQAVRMMMGGNKKLPDDIIQKMKEQQIRVMEEELKDGVVIMRDRGEPERKIEAFVKKKRGDIFEARGLPRDMDDFYADGGVVSFAPYLR